jgi:hypothetical protein
VVFVMNEWLREASSIFDNKIVVSL